MIAVLTILIALAITAILSFSGFARTPTWRATVTPLASILGSGFLICGPLLAREFGSAAIAAMAALLAIAYAVSVAYYLKLLAEFAMKPLAVPDAWPAKA